MNWAGHQQHLPPTVPETILWFNTYKLLAPSVQIYFLWAKLTTNAAALCRIHLLLAHSVSFSSPDISDQSLEFFRQTWGYLYPINGYQLSYFLGATGDFHTKRFPSSSQAMPPTYLTSRHRSPPTENHTIKSQSKILSFISCFFPDLCWLVLDLFYIM